MAKISEEPNEDNLENKIQIYSNDDEKLKFLGKMLNNDSSRKILQMLIEKEMTANEIATQTQLSLPLALYHVNQMIEAGIAVISKTSTNGKNQSMKHYSAKPGIIILPEKASQKAKESKSFSKSLKSIMKFTVIGFAGIVSWITVKPGPSVSLDRTVSPYSIDPIIISIAIPVTVVATGIILERILAKWFNKKSKK